MTSSTHIGVGSQLGSYKLLRLLGEGGMGAVYEAEHRSISRHVAIKVLHPEFALRNDLVQRFFNEARAVNLIDHPGLVQISDYGQADDGTAFIVMELLRGEPLSKRLKRSGALTVADTLRLGRQIAAALSAVHKKGIVHRDTTRKNKICSLTGHKAIHRRRTDDADALFTHWPL